MRLPGYDYCQAGGYFITICTHLNLSLFGEIVDKKMILNEFGVLVGKEWIKTEDLRKEVTLDDFTIMPNHLHGIIIIDYVLPNEDVLIKPTVGADGSAPLVPDGRPPLQRFPGSLGSIVAGFKSSATKRINIIRGTSGKPLWERGYYDRVIRNEEELDRIREFIRNNPARFEKCPRAH